MPLYAQHGYGKAEKLNTLADAGDLAGVILSPADEGAAALRGTARAMARRGVETLLDPQTYVYTIPDAVGRCHDESGLNFGPIYWSTATPADVEAQVDAVIAANVAIGTTGPVISPAPRQGTVTDLWLPLALQYARTTVARVPGRPVFGSLVIEDTGMAQWAAMEQWLDVATSLDVQGFYLVVARRSSYPAAWDRLALTNLLRVVYRLAVLNEYRVVVGYADLAGLGAIAMGAHAIASGWNYMQRQFVSERWVPRPGGRQPIPRVTSAALLSPLQGVGEMDSVARSALGPVALTDAALLARMAGRADSWTKGDAHLQHLQVLAQLVRDLEARGAVPARLDALTASAGEARRLLTDLRSRGVALEAVHLNAVTTLGAAVADARRAEGI